MTSGVAQEGHTLWFLFWGTAVCVFSCSKLRSPTAGTPSPDQVLEAPGPVTENLQPFCVCLMPESCMRFCHAEDSAPSQVTFNAFKINASFGFTSRAWCKENEPCECLIRRKLVCCEQKQVSLGSPPIQNLARKAARKMWEKFQREVQNTSRT